MAIALATAIGLATRFSLAWSSADELVRQARAHEEGHEEDIAARRYTEALSLDGTNEAAWLGLAQLRYRLGEVAEAERVYSAALTRVPTFYRAYEGRAECLWALHRHGEAETSLQQYADVTSDPAAFRVLAEWFGKDGRSPAELAVWRRLLAMAVDRSDAASATEARLMVRALVALVAGADPVSAPEDEEPTRRVIAQIARAR